MNVLIARAEYFASGFLTPTKREQLLEFATTATDEFIEMASDGSIDRADYSIVAWSIGASLLRLNRLRPAERLLISAFRGLETDKPMLAFDALDLLTHVFRQQGRLADQLAVLRRAAMVLPNIEDGTIRTGLTVKLASEFSVLGDFEEAEALLEDTELTPEVAKLFGIEGDIEGGTFRVFRGKPT